MLFLSNKLLNRATGGTVSPEERVPHARPALAAHVRREAVVRDARAVPDEVRVVGHGHGGGEPAYLAGEQQESPVGRADRRPRDCGARTHLFR